MTRILSFQLFAALAVSSATGCMIGEVADSSPAGDPSTDAEGSGSAALGAWKVLPVDYQVQETGYWCGPAATRIALSARMAPPSQQQLANELGTTTNGTDWIGQVTAVLNRRGGLGYRTVEMPNDPPTAAQRDRLWSDIVLGIEAGYPLVLNIVAPPSNHPPGYPNETIYHYFAAIGYNPQTREVYIADSANFSGKQRYWLSFDQVASLVPPKGYAAVGCGSSGTIGAIHTKFVDLGGCGSLLGAPVGNELRAPDQRGRFHVFESGSIYWTPQTGAHEVHGIIRDKYRDEGWEAGYLGYPVSDEQKAPDGTGRFSVFEGGSIYWSPDTGARVVRGRIRDKYEELGWEAGPLGYPIADEADVDGGKRSVFERGAITWLSASDTFVVEG